MLVVDRRPGTSGLPRASGINVRTVEILRTWGVAPAVRAHRIRVVPEAASAATLVAPPRSSGRAGGYPSPREILEVSPVLPLACPQDLLEPVLVDAVRRAGGEIRFGTPLVALTVGPDGVRAELGSGPRVHARFVVGADGTRSTVRAALGIATTHLGTWAHAVQVLFRPRTPLPQPHRLLTFVDEPHPGALCPMGAGRWTYVGLRFDGSRPDVPDDWTPTLRAASGLPDLAVEVLDVQRFTLAAEVATTYRAGPGFLVGDAAHRTTPVAGIGLNTAIHDGHELGWKLAWAARGLAGDALLASHDAERGPVGLAAAARSLDVQGRPTDGLPSALGHTHRSPVIAGTEPAPDLRIDLTARPGRARTARLGPARGPPPLDARPVRRHPHPAHGRGRAAVGARRGRRHRGAVPGARRRPRRPRRHAGRAVRAASGHRGARAPRRPGRLAARRRLRRPGRGADAGRSTRRSAAWPSPPHWPADIIRSHHRWRGRAERARWPPGPRSTR